MCFFAIPSAASLQDGERQRQTNGKLNASRNAASSIALTA
jgi:hypothetical protein